MTAIRKGQFVMKNEISVSLQPVETRRASEKIYDQIRQLILDGEIKPGDRLPSERKMMDMMKRSRPTIREAMRMLERDGYIKIFSGSIGAVVQEINVDNAVQSLETVMQMNLVTVENVLEFRRMTESEAAKLAAKRGTSEGLKKIEDILKLSGEAFGNAEQFKDYDLKFHLAVAEASHNAMYVIMLQVCRNMIDESLTEILGTGKNQEREERYRRIHAAHCAIYEAIKKGQGDMASQNMKNHLADAEDDILKRRLS